MVWPKTTVPVTDLKLLRYDTVYVPSYIKYFSDVPVVTTFSAVHVPVILKFYIIYKTLILNSILFTHISFGTSPFALSLIF